MCVCAIMCLYVYVFVCVYEYMCVFMWVYVTGPVCVCVPMSIPMVRGAEHQDSLIKVSFCG